MFLRIVCNFYFHHGPSLNRFGGGILIYIKEGITNKLLSKHTFSDDIEYIFVEINLRKMK